MSSCCLCPLQFEKLMCQLIHAIDTNFLRMQSYQLLCSWCWIVFCPRNFVVETAVARFRKLHFAGWNCPPRGKAKDGEGELREGEECPHGHGLKSRQPRRCSGDHRQRGEVPMSSVLESKEMTSNKKKSQVLPSKLQRLRDKSCSFLFWWWSLIVLTWKRRTRTLILCTCSK